MAISENDRRDAYLSRIRVPALDVEGFAAMLRRRAVFIATVTSACAAISLLSILLSVPKYTASGQLLLNSPGAQAGGDGVANRVSAVTSRGVLDKVIAREKLETDPLFGGRSRGVFPAFLAGLGLVSAADPPTMALRQLRRVVSITRSPVSGVVNVSVVTPDRETSERIANAVMDSYVEEQARLHADATHGIVAPPGSRLDTLQARLRNAEQRYEKFRSDSELAKVGSQVTAETQVSQISAQIVVAEAKVDGLRSRLRQLQRAGKTVERGGIPETIREDAVRSFRSRYAAAKRLEIDLSKTLGPRHPDRVIARMQTNEAKLLLDRAIRDAAQSIAAERERARRIVTQLKIRLEASKQDLVKSNETTARLKELEREVEANRVAYQAMLERSRSSTETQLDISNARILSRAALSVAPDGTFPAGILLVSALFGLGLGGSLAWLLELVDERKKTPALH